MFWRDLTRPIWVKYCFDENQKWTHTLPMFCFNKFLNLSKLKHWSWQISFDYTPPILAPFWGNLVLTWTWQLWEVHKNQSSLKVDMSYLQKPTLILHHVVTRLTIMRGISKLTLLHNWWVLSKKKLEKIDN